MGPDMLEALLPHAQAPRPVTRQVSNGPAQRFGILLGQNKPCLSIQDDPRILVGHSDKNGLLQSTGLEARSAARPKMAWEDDEIRAVHDFEKVLAKAGKLDTSFDTYTARKIVGAFEVGLRPQKPG